MELNTTFTNDLHLVLQELLDEKSRRDCVPFTVYKLAKALKVNDSVLCRILHVDPAKRVQNPRADTLTKIVDFFKADGFQITIDDLLASIKTKSVDVQSQATGLFSVDKKVMVYSFASTHEDPLGSTQIKLTTDHHNIIALLSDEDIKPLFKKGSLFIIDTKAIAEDDNFVAVKLNNNKTTIRKFHVENNKKILRSYDNNIQDVELTSQLNYSILGVVVQINAKT